MVLQPVSSRMAYHTFSLVYALPSMTPRSQRMIVGWSLDYAISTKISSRFIYNFIKFIWNLTALLKLIFGVWISAPPIMRMVAASGTTSTLYPICFKCSCKVARAVVLPAHGPPVTHIRVIGVLVFCLDSCSLDCCTIGSSILLVLLAIEHLSSSSRSWALADERWTSFKAFFLSPCSE